MKKYWECDKCKKKFREYSSYHSNIGIIDSSINKKICINCYNKGNLK